MSKARHRNIACFISPHGLGHATRAAAVLAALQRLQPDIHLHLFTTAPPALFAASGCRHVVHHAEYTDVGFAQQSALMADLPATVRQLDELLPFPSDRIEALAATVRRGKCGLVLCDIAPLGIAVARQAGVPSVLIENFLWDDLYRHYAADYPPLARHAEALNRIFSQANLHIQTQPVCCVSEADLTTGPVSRIPVQTPASIRKTLALEPEVRMVLITMGGVSEQSPLLTAMAHRQDIVFVVAWGSARISRTGNVIRLPLDTDYYHPDLVHASDAVIGKVGYSTLAEVYHAGVPFGYVPREGYPEMPPLVEFIGKEMTALAIPPKVLENGIPLEIMDQLLSLPRRPPSLPNGAALIADFLAPLLHRTP